MEYMGRVEVFDRTRKQWGTICTNDVSYNLAKVVCKSLGYFSYRSHGQASYFTNVKPSPNSPIINGTILCFSIYRTLYTYYNLYQCSNFESNLKLVPSRCTSDQEWVVVCARKFIGVILVMYMIHR